jgi:hypothetical protein|nr:MAG TPA: minor capsid protein [Caudoviricetes sp.]
MARPNEADRGTDRALADLERRINSVYSKASKELQEEIDAFFKHFADQDKKMQDLIGQKRNGKEWTEKDYQQWRLNQMGRGARLEALRDKLAERATEAKEVALAYVNDATPGIYSLNRNYTAYTIESVHPSADFTLFDEQTVKRLIVEQPDVMPYYPERLALKRGIDLAFGKQQITASVTGSILQGRSIKQISDDLQSRIVTMSRVSAIRAARTAVTAAQNAGRMDSYAAADEMWGIKSKKKWVATKDLRTRHDHGMADNQIVDYDQPFDVGGYKMMFPGDGSLGAPGHELYNCRCTVVNATDDDLEAERHMMRVKNPETGEYELVKKKSYKEWYDEKKAQYPPEKWAGMVKAGKNYQADQREYAEYREILGKKAPKTFSAFQNMKYNQPDVWKQLQEELKKNLGKKVEEPAINVFGKEITFDAKIEENDRFNQSVTMIKQLSARYKTKLQEVKLGSQKSAGSVQISGSIMNLSSKDQATVIHEFAHTISMENQTKFGLYDEKGFWKDVRKEWRAYKKKVGDDTSKWISTYEHSSNSADEFMAEAFTLATLNEYGLDVPKKYGDGLEYAKIILAIIKRYFGR